MQMYLALGPVLAAAIPSLIELAGQGFNAISQGMTNRSNQQFAEKQYAQQRKDSLADWNMQNEYNSPQAQMQRFKSAGLNPNMVYGGGATTTAQPVRSSQAPTIHKEPIKMDLGSATQMYYNVQQQKLTNDNLKAQNEAIKTRTKLDLAKEYGMMTENERRIFDFQVAKDLAPGNLQMQMANIRKLGVDTQHMQASTDEIIQRNLQGKELHPYKIKELTADISNKISQTSKNKNDIEYSRVMAQVAKNQSLMHELEINYKKERDDIEAKKIKQEIDKLEYENGILYRSIDALKVGSSLIRK